MYKYIQILLFIVCFSIQGFGQEVKTIKLKQQTSDFQPKNYHIVSVIDSRADTTNIGTMRKGLANKEAVINLYNGAQYAIAEYISSNIKQNPNTTPIILHIKELDIKEEKVNYKQQLNLHLGLAYYIGTNMLIEYTGTAYIQTGYDASAYIDKIIRSNIESNFKEFDRWMAQNKQNIATSPTVKVEVSFAKKSTDKNLIIHGERQLRLDDFIGTPDEMSLGSAATFSGINARYNIEQLGMTTTIRATITPYFNKNKSWVKDEGYNTFILSHEQLHFDITALKACQLAERIKAFNFSTNNYSEELSTLLSDIDREAEELQRKYDTETAHGTLQNEQERWQKEIANQLSKQNCY